MADEYFLVPERDESGEETGFYTREPDGASGMTVSALAEFVGASQPGVISSLLKRIRESDPLSNNLTESLQPFAGKDLRLVSNDSKGRLIVPDDACQAIAEYYTFDARDFDGKDVASRNYRAISKAGMRIFIWSRTGYVPPTFRQQREPLRGTYWYERVKVALSDTTKPLQAGYFCAYLEMMKFFQELEIHADYVVLDTDPQTGKYVVPDISIGRMFNNWLRSNDESARAARLKFLGSEKLIDFRERRQNLDKVTKRRVWVEAGLHYSEILEYKHVYPEASHGENNKIDVKSYPDKYLLIFRHYLANVWIPDECSRYLLERDHKGWSQVLLRLSQLPPATRQALSGTFIGSLLPSLPAGES